MTELTAGEPTTYDNVLADGANVKVGTVMVKVMVADAFAEPQVAVTVMREVPPGTLLPIFNVSEFVFELIAANDVVTPAGTPTAVKVALVDARPTGFVITSCKGLPAFERPG